MGKDARIWAFGLLGLGMAWAGAGCDGLSGEDPAKQSVGQDRSTVVVYSALDEEFSRPILEAYGKAARVKVEVKYDVESTKTVGLTNLLIAEAGRPRCDLFWNNEILNTIRLRQKGLLQEFRPPNADAYPINVRDENGTWYGFAARARILLIDTRQIGDADRPRGIMDLNDPRWKGKVGLAKPLFGTTATHAACLFNVLGEEKAKAFFKGLKENEARVFSGNKQVAKAVASGEIAIGLTDTDDAMIELEQGGAVAIVYPDLGRDQIGTLFIPNTLCVPKGATHSEAATELANHLLSATVEEALAAGPSAQIPLGRTATDRARIESPETVKAMKVDFEAAASQWDKAAAFLAEEFGGP
ncbi:extracellular solute-binding protein [Isosphaeraceae bacterium EP7]